MNNKKYKNYNILERSQGNHISYQVEEISDILFQNMFEAKVYIDQIIKDNLKLEMINFINENNLNDIFTQDDRFFERFGCHIYMYLRVSTEQQEFGRQILELYDWIRKKGITVRIDDIYCDKYTGKTLKRDAYLEMRSKVISGDYILLNELSRLGRNWDDVKEEWAQLKKENIKCLIADFAPLCSTLPFEVEEITLEKAMIQDITFAAMNYVNSKKIQDVSRTTKAGIQKAKLKGKKIGKPAGKHSTKDNFINTIRYCLKNNVGYRKACIKTLFPISTFEWQLRRYREQYGVHEMKDLLEILERNI